MSFGELSRKDKIKLIYAYVVTPLMIILQTAGKLNELRAAHGIASQVDVPCGAVIASGMIDSMVLLFPPTIIRFLYFHRDLQYGIEIYCSMIISLVVTTLLYYPFVSSFVVSAGLFGSLAVYSVLSFGSRRMNTFPRIQRCMLTLVTLAVPFIILHVYQDISPKSQQVYFPLWEAIVLSVVLNSYVYNPSTAGDTDGNTHESSQNSQSNSQGTSYRFEDASSKSRPPDETPEQRLMSIGLASIGRKTRMMNKYMTAEQIEMRRRIEYPFLKVLADRYKDEKQRKILSRHFMLFKEMCLFISLGVILRDKKREHELIKTDLTHRLSEGLTVQAREWRDDYWRILTKNFYDRYTENKDIVQSLSQSFWGTLPMKYPEILITEDIVMQSAVRIQEIFRYIYGSMMKEHE